MTASVRTRTKAPRAIVTGVEVSEADREVIPGEPGDQTERCGKCRGHGLLRGKGKNAGQPYRTTAGAQAALEHGNAVDCPGCKGEGVTERAPF